MKKENLISKERYKKRMKICLKCEFFEPKLNRCLKCGCFLMVKAAFRTTSCPIDKWEI